MFMQKYLKVKCQDDQKLMCGDRGRENGELPIMWQNVNN